MKKRILLLVSLLLSLLLLSSCAMVPLSLLGNLYITDVSSASPSGAQPSVQDQGSVPDQTTDAKQTSGQEESSVPAQSSSVDTVTISREEYEFYQQFSEMYELYNAASAIYYQTPDAEKMTEYAARGVLAGLDDPYTFYYNPEEFAELWEEDEGNYTGIGVLISANTQTQICTISRVFKGSPAEEVGVQRGDILYRVGEDLYVTATNLQDAVDIMRGEPGTDVDVTFLRNGEELTFTITRKMISVNQIESKMLDDSTGYIALYEFAGQCEQEFEAALNRLVAQGAKGILLDLRDNPGGWVDQARYIADLFMDEGELCYLKYRDGQERHGDYLTVDGKVNTALVVLINENSASSSEILTGALRDCAGATVVGVKSYGKGIIQGVYPVGNRGAGYQMTIAQYFTPSGAEVHKKGIEPEVEVSLPEGDNGMYDFADLENDVQLRRAFEVLTEKMKAAPAQDSQP